MTGQFHLREYSGGRHRRKLLTKHPKTDNEPRAVSPSELGPNCPTALAEYLTKLLLADPDGECAEHYDEHKLAWLRWLDTLMVSAATVLGIPVASLPSHCGFSFGDVTENRFMSFIGELRAILYLENEGHVQIRRAKSKKKQAEGTSLLGIHRFAWEVKCLGKAGDWDRRIEPPFHISRSTVADKPMTEVLSNSIMSLWKDKASIQLRATAVDENCDQELLVVVIDYPPFVTHLTHDDFHALLVTVHKLLSLEGHQHIALVTGMSSAFGNETQDYIYPEWPGGPDERSLPSGLA